MDKKIGKNSVKKTGNPPAKKQVSKVSKKSVAEKSVAKQSVAESQRMDSRVDSEQDHPEGTSQFMEEDEHDPDAVYTTFHQAQGADDEKMVTQPLVTKDMEFDREEPGDDGQKMADDLQKVNAFENSQE